ncbi:EAL domain-containing protein [Acidovorax sp. SUPP3434]|uniref:bifunctional diguanylate cyclase/phosphodiesterase n=1 Tax=Acidovorax sp. SUPP3434 TaxID=2920880 RepID=UPI0024E18E73|nr:EAL domain-containing protein [Acidovorax sp. SUPP3434]
MPSISRRIRIAVGSVVAVFLLALAGAAAWLVWSTRHSALAESEAQVTRFATGAEAAVNRSLLGLDVLLASTADLMAMREQVHESRDPGAVSQLLRAAARQNLMVRYVALLDGQRKVVASSDTAGGRVGMELPLGFFEEVMGQPVPTLAISVPTISFASSERVLYVARHVRALNGERLIAVAQVPTSMLVSVLTQAVDISGLEVTLERGQGQMLLGFSGRGDARHRARVHPLSEVGVPISAWGQGARITGVSSLVVARPILYPDFWISASLPEAAALSAWRSERTAIVLVALFFGVTVAVAGLFTIAYLTRMNRARMALASSKSTLDQALGSMVTGFVLLGRDLEVLQWNRRFEDMFPWLRGVMTNGLPFRALLEATVLHHLPEASERQRREWVDQRLALQRHPQGTHEQMLPNGHFIQITERATPEGGLMISYHDVTDLRLASAEIENLAFYDLLTGLPNRRLLLDRLNQAAATAARSRELGALLFLDLDHFKTLNDTQGHEVGDLLLQQVAVRLKDCVRTTDTVARLGGDEFVVMLCDLARDPQEAATLARRIGEKILLALSKPYQLRAQTHHSNCSIGATVFGDSRQSAAELLKQADIAMYQVKARRGHGLCFFDPQMQVVITQRAQLEVDLQVAIQQGQFVLHYQPQFTLPGTMVGVEALLRWQHPERGLVAPGHFIAVAEESELIVPIGMWVLRTACEQLAEWQRDPRLRNVHVSVNVSARQFRHPDFVAGVVEVIQETGIRPHLLELELTESLVLDNVEDSVAKMHLLRTKGVRFSVDDFGTGYSSLAYLTRLPLHQLKIDQSFVRNLGVRPTDDVIVQTIIGMARNLELQVIAEGVETAEQKDFLALHGCDLYQGYLFARPLPVEELVERFAGTAAPSAPLPGPL